MNNILVKTTFKDNLILLKPFINFYNDIWNPETYIIYIGYAKQDKQNIINEINNILNCKIQYIKKLHNIDTIVEDTELYSYSNYNFVLYKTTVNTPARIWDGGIRPFLLKLDSYIVKQTYKFFINVDNDDFFYVKNVKKLLESNKGSIKFHTFEFIPHKTFNINDNFEFISNPYFYRIKSLRKSMNIKNSHNYCRELYIDNRYMNEGHTEHRKEVCKLYDEIKEININDFDYVCFAFGCLDLDYLLNTKQWLQSSGDSTNIFEHSRDKIISDFNNYYTLNENDRSNNIIFAYNNLKKYFL